MVKSGVVACNSCHTDISVVDSSTQFKCPKCKENIITRCGTCRRRGVSYVCACGFKGP